MDYPRRQIKWTRYAVQVAVLAICAYAGWQFYHFVLHYADPSAPPGVRPPSIEGFLPIGGFMALKYFLMTRIIDPIHPAGFIIFAGALLTALFARKGFCSWVCPVGSLSEYAWRLGRKITGRVWRLPKWADYTLMSPKYLIMGAFFFVIGITMTPTMILMFFIQDYYKAVDVKMLMFFLDPSMLAASVVIALTAVSFFVPNFWCRYLCPYGALLGLLAYASPLKVSRNPEACIDCKACSKACPSGIAVAEKMRVTSPECTGCLTCVSSCPTEGALDVSLRKHAFHPHVYAAVLVVAFFGPIVVGMGTDNWQSKLPEKEYTRLIPKIVTPDMKKQPLTAPGMEHP